MPSDLITSTGCELWQETVPFAEHWFNGNFLSILIAATSVQRKICSWIILDYAHANICIGKDWMSHRDDPAVHDYIAQGRSNALYLDVTRLCPIIMIGNLKHSLAIDQLSEPAEIRVHVQTSAYDLLSSTGVPDGL